MQEAKLSESEAVGQNVPKDKCINIFLRQMEVFVFMIILQIYFNVRENVYEQLAFHSVDHFSVFSDTIL